MELFEKAKKGKRDREEITDNGVFLKLKKKRNFLTQNILTQIIFEI